MKENSPEENEKLKLFLSIAQDALLVIFLGFSTWGVNKFIDWIELDTMIDKIVLNVLVWVLGISTIFSALAFLAKDIVKVSVKTWLDIKEELAKLNNKLDE